jgi:DNA polymerase-3 subunit beta
MLKLSLNANECRKAVSFVAGVINRKSSLSVLGMLHVSGNGTTVLSTTDLDNWALTELDVKSIVDGVCLLPREAVMNAFKAKSGEVGIEMGDGLMAEIVAAGMKRTVLTLDVEEFPPVPAFKPELSLEVKAGELMAALKRVEAAQSTEASRYVLIGVCFEIEPGNVALVATDGRRLHRTNIERGDLGTEKGQFILPSSAVKHLLRMPAVKEADTVLIEASVKENWAAFRYGPHTLISRLIDDNYPNYQAVIRKEHKLHAGIVADAFEIALNQVKVACTENSKGVNLTFQNDRLKLKAGNAANGEAHADMLVDYPANLETMTIAFDPAYLLDICAMFKGRKLTLGMLDELNGGNFFEGNDLAVLMPMRKRRRSCVAGL